MMRCELQRASARLLVIEWRGSQQATPVAQSREVPAVHRQYAMVIETVSGRTRTGGSDKGGTEGEGFSRLRGRRAQTTHSATSTRQSLEVEVPESRTGFALDNDSAPTDARGYAGAPETETAGALERGLRR